MPSIEVDFNNCDQEGRVRLNTIGAIRSLNESQVTLRNKLEVELTSGDFFPIKGIVEYSDSERIWVARFDINVLRDKYRAAIRVVTVAIVRRERRWTSAGAPAARKLVRSPLLSPTSGRDVKTPSS
jgi:hypothetical protein